jgi:hypothetical protein
VQTVVLPAQPAAELARWSARVARANGWDGPESFGKAAYPPIEHVVYIIKENRTYDQVLGDLPQADGDTALLFFPRPVSPNHHALAERFGIFDRFFTNAEVSADGPQLRLRGGKPGPGRVRGRGRRRAGHGLPLGRGAARGDQLPQLWRVRERGA